MTWDSIERRSSYVCTAAPPGAVDDCPEATLAVEHPVLHVESESVTRRVRPVGARRRSLVPEVDRVFARVSGDVDVDIALNTFFLRCWGFDSVVRCA